MQILRQPLIFWVVLAGIAMGAAPGAKAKMTLTPEIKQHLASLATVGDRPVARSLFDGRPVLVKFFASW